MPLRISTVVPSLASSVPIELFWAINSYICSSADDCVYWGCFRDCAVYPVRCKKSSPSVSMSSS